MTLISPDVPNTDATALAIPDRDELRFLPEGPIAIDDDGRLSWVAIQHAADRPTGSLNVLELGTMTNTEFVLPGRPGFAFPTTRAGRFVIGLERSLGFFDTRSNTWEPFCDGIDASVTNTIINDGLVLDDNLIFGCKDLQFAEKKAGLYLYRGRDRKLIQLRDDQVCSNGKMIRQGADGSLHLIDIDSPTRLIVEYPLDIDAGTLGAPRTRIDLTDDAGVPDGAVLTPDGTGVVVSIFLPAVASYGQTRWYDLETGRLRHVWRTPGSPQNTCPALIQHRGKIHLLITTAVENMSSTDREQCPTAGQLFLAETDFAGPLEHCVFKCA